MFYILSFDSMLEISQRINEVFMATDNLTFPICLPKIVFVQSIDARFHSDID